MLGTSEKMQDVYATIRKVSPSDIPVLVTGESGTGKELVARAIHRLSPRSGGPFVVINCGAIPENLLESELFGHEKGSFTGAHAQRKGRIELAHGGTLFLDEIGELPLQLQVKLLRFLQDNIIERIGGRHPIPVDVRIVAATNRDLKEGMSQGTFREDLYFRLGVVTVSLPPLRERGRDILLLAKAFTDHFAGEYNKKITGFSDRAAKALENHTWQGNIRELENRIKRAVVMAEGKRIEPRDLELEEAASDGARAMTLKEAREEIEKEMVLRALSRNEGNLSRTAADLGVSRPTLYDLMEKFGIPRKAG
jgi:two-component system NtrC family response regulator